MVFCYSNFTDFKALKKKVIYSAVGRCRPAWEKNTSTTGHDTARTNGLQDGDRAKSYRGLQGKPALSFGNAAAGQLHYK